MRKSKKPTRQTVPSINSLKELKRQKSKDEITPNGNGDRKFILRWLFFPLVITVIFFIIGIIAVMNADVQRENMILKMAVASMGVLTVAMMFLPSYLISIISWHVATTRKGYNPVKFLWTIPFISTLFCWFPTFLLAPAQARTFDGFIMMCLSSLILWGIWVIIVRLILRFWKKI